MHFLQESTYILHLYFVATGKWQHMLCIKPLYLSSTIGSSPIVLTDFLRCEARNNFPSTSRSELLVVAAAVSVFDQKRQLYAWDINYHCCFINVLQLGLLLQCMGITIHFPSIKNYKALCHACVLEFRFLFFLLQSGHHDFFTRQQPSKDIESKEVTSTSIIFTPWETLKLI